MKLSPLTPKILIYKIPELFYADDAIDWAIEMLQAGYESPALFILAGISKPSQFAEVEDHISDALKELHIPVPDFEKAIRDYCALYIEEIAKGKNIKRNLKYLHSVYVKLTDDINTLYDFHLLYWAWGDLDYNGTYQHYWDGATKDNIELIVIDVAKKWIKENHR